MQRHKSAEKAARKNKKANAVNRVLLSRIKTAMKNVLESKDHADAQKELSKAFSIIDKGAKVNLIHANNAANKKARLSKYVLSLIKK
jgi:small subunit ribosomal protein S20